jgi:hypothetical protein
MAIVGLQMLGVLEIHGGKRPCILEEWERRFAYLAVSPDAARKMSESDRPAKRRAFYQVISDLTNLATACAADDKFREQTYMPLAKSVGDEAPKACQR